MVLGVHCPTGGSPRQPCGVSLPVCCGLARVFAPDVRSAKQRQAISCRDLRPVIPDIGRRFRSATALTRRSRTGSGSAGAEGKVGCRLPTRSERPQTGLSRVLDKPAAGGYCNVGWQIRNCRAARGVEMCPGC